MYRYNERISSTGYYLKPVHYVYKRTTTGKVVFHYYGRYWLKKLKGKTIYIGQTKPPELPPPPRSIWESFVLIEIDSEYYMELDHYKRFEKQLRKMGIRGYCK